LTTVQRIAAIAATFACLCFGQGDFYLKEGNRVVFYGDSITDQRLYTTFVETFAVTRFPDRNLTFVHSGWGGDRVTGGAGGGIAQRLARDVFAYKPDVVTVMLGMNDGRYRPFDKQIFDTYANGYRNIVKRLKAELLAVRITAIQPSPYDDVTRPPMFEGGYNAVLLQFGGFLKELSQSEGVAAADLNGPVVAMLQKANAADPENAKKIIADRIHPGAAGHLIMAAALLRAWNAPSLVSSITIDAAARKVAASENTSVAEARFGQTIAWTQTDRSLPMPIDMTDPVMALAVESSDFIDTLNRQIVRVTGLPAGAYTLNVDGDEIATFSAAELAAGANLAMTRTPMTAQAAQVHALTLKRANIHNTRWRSVQTPLQRDSLTSDDAAIASLDALASELARSQRAMAQPKAHRFELVPGGSPFKSIFNGSDLSGWHRSEVNHHGKTQGWVVEEGAITGTQDKPGHGGILLTDRKNYKNFEVQLEIKPDHGCDSGLFLRSNEKGQAYQVLLDYLDGGAIGGIYGEGLKGVQGYVPDWQSVWKSGAWNHLRARIEGDIPHIQVWLNGVKITDWRDTENHLPDGAVEGMIAVQVHIGNRWVPGGKHRFRNIQVRDLP
jgi:lysophospholipase L1-like esterase